MDKDRGERERELGGGVGRVGTVRWKVGESGRNRRIEREGGSD